jgi:hypothetical protein
LTCRLCFEVLRGAQRAGLPFAVAMTVSPEPPTGAFSFATCRAFAGSILTLP